MTKKKHYPDISAIRELPALTSQVTPERWEDQNGHINVGFYMALYNDSGWPLLDLVGIDERYCTERKMGFVDLDNHIHYLRELHVGDHVTTYGKFLANDDKRIHGMVFVINDSTNALAATIEYLSINFDLRNRRVVAIPADIAAELTAMNDAHQKLGWTVPTCMSVAR